MLNRLLAIVIVIGISTAALGDDPKALLDKTRWEAQARKFIAHWLVVQNTGDFPAYQKLYARKFTGMQRSANAVHPWNRTNWMRDRSRMFKSPMKVQVQDIRVSILGPWTAISFIQE